MTIFDDRERAFETKYFQDQDLEFHIMVRRDKLFGQWIAQLAGLQGEDAAALIRMIIDTEIATHTILGTVAKELVRYGHPLGESELKVKLLECHEIAREQVYKEHS